MNKQEALLKISAYNTLGYVQASGSSFIPPSGVDKGSKFQGCKITSFGVAPRDTEAIPGFKGVILTSVSFESPEIRGNVGLNKEQFDLVDIGQTIGVEVIDHPTRKDRLMFTLMVQTEYKTKTKVTA
jgi:hypothetical protein